MEETSPPAPAAPVAPARGHVNAMLEHVAAQLARHLQIELVRTVGDRSGPKSAEWASAEELSMRGWTSWFGGGLNAPNALEALALFERAVALDPNRVQAWGGVNTMSQHAARYGWVEDRAAARVRLKRTSEAQAAFDDFRTRHPKIEPRMSSGASPGTHPLFAQTREQLLADLRGLGFR